MSTAPAQISLGTGRRKTSVARVRLQAGSGNFTINSRTLEDFFHNDDQYLRDVLSPLIETGKKDQVDVSIRLNGGGVTGAAGACKLGIARALRKHDPETYETLKNAGLLTRDSRMIERKKYGLHKARKATQFSKR
jgi:small subunit ribosomal protein S9